MERYFTLEELVGQMDEPWRGAARSMLADHSGRFQASPGSRSAHQAWPGGYWDHVCETMNVALRLYATLSEVRDLPFTLSDALLVLFLHDVEKPFKYVGPDAGVPLDTKEDRADFRLRLAGAYSMPLTQEVRNGLTYVEGELDYVPGERHMGPLAAFCHMADIASARLWHDRPAEERETWGQRITLKDQEPK